MINLCKCKWSSAIVVALEFRFDLNVMHGDSVYEQAFLVALSRGKPRNMVTAACATA